MWKVHQSNEHFPNIAYSVVETSEPTFEFTGVKYLNEDHVGFSGSAVGFPQGINCGSA